MDDQNRGEHSGINAIQENTIDSQTTHTHNNNARENKYKLLLEVLPDANPHFLKKASYRLLDDDSFNKFIEDSLQSKNYPKRDDYYNYKEFVNNWKKYVTCFDVEEFLKTVPNPVQFFSSRTVSYQKNYGWKFVKERYKKLTSCNVKDIYRRKKFDVVKTCDSIDHHYPYNYCHVSHRKFRSALPLVLIKEIAFIQNKHAILKYMKAKEKIVEKAYKTAEKKGELLECECCFSTCVVNDVTTCDDGHVFCKPCVKKGTEVAFANGGVRFPCYKDQCTSQFSLQTLEQVVDAKLFSRITTCMQFNEVKSAKIEGLEMCPFCTFCVLPAAEDKLFKCLNPQCLKTTCRFCKKLDHLPLTCDEIVKSEDDNLKMVHSIENRMTEALIRVCWNCQNRFVKEYGCNKMTCNVCRATMCYVCRAPIYGYSHFNQDCDDSTSSKCPLWTTETKLHVDAILNEGKLAKAELEAVSGVVISYDPISNFSKK